MLGPPSPLNPTYENCFVQGPHDALILVQAVIDGRLTPVERRPQDQERSKLIKSGNVFIFNETRSHIQRWTDGISWSPSRILGEFLIYREKKQSHRNSAISRKGRSSPGYERKLGSSSNGVSKKQLPPRHHFHSHHLSNSVDQTNPMMMTPTFGYPQYPGFSMNFTPLTSPVSRHQSIEYNLYGSLTSNDQYKENGLIKKTISIPYKDSSYRLISYYFPDDVETNRLLAPSQDPNFSDISIDSELAEKKNLKVSIPINHQELMMSLSYNQRIPVGVYDYPHFGPVGQAPPMIHPAMYGSSMAQRSLPPHPLHAHQPMQPPIPPPQSAMYDTPDMLNYPAVEGVPYPPMDGSGGVIGGERRPNEAGDITIPVVEDYPDFRPASYDSKFDRSCSTRDQYQDVDSYAPYPLEENTPGPSFTEGMPISHYDHVATSQQSGNMALGQYSTADTNQWDSLNEHTMPPASDSPVPSMRHSILQTDTSNKGEESRSVDGGGADQGVSRNPLEQDMSHQDEVPKSEPLSYSGDTSNLSSQYELSQHLMGNFSLNNGDIGQPGRISASAISQESDGYLYSSTSSPSDSHLNEMAILSNEFGKAGDNSMGDGDNNQLSTGSQRMYMSAATTTAPYDIRSF